MFTFKMQRSMAEYRQPASKKEKVPPASKLIKSSDGKQKNKVKIGDQGLAAAVGKSHLAHSLVTATKLLSFTSLCKTSKSKCVRDSRGADTLMRNNMRQHAKSNNNSPSQDKILKSNFLSSLTPQKHSVGETMAATA
nr:DNA helicase, ATP-dependent, RecQ type [Tanacetum cinerariifolium]